MKKKIKLSQKKRIQNRLKELEEEIKLFRKYYNFSDEEKLISIKIISIDQQINYNTIAKNSEIFSKIEFDLYNKYEKYKFNENYFLVGGRKINRNLNLKDNNIKTDDIITLCKIEE